MCETYELWCKEVGNKKLIKLKEDLKWFKNKIGNMNIKKLLKVIDKRIKEIPKESKNFNTQVHGQTSI